jgi:REP element-mobilizing transposase RayT
MPFNPDIHHRRSIRLPGYDYTGAGAYFITICTQNRQCLFGEIADGVMRLNEAGFMIRQWFDELEKKFSAIECDEFICMPNHIHFIVNVGADLCVRPLPSSSHGNPGQTRRSAPTKPSLSDIVQWFKTMTTNEYIRCVKAKGWQTFPGKLWQRNFHERIIRDEAELNGIRDYIQNNPAQWEQDDLHVSIRQPTA